MNRYTVVCIDLDSLQPYIFCIHARSAESAKEQFEIGNVMVIEVFDGHLKSALEDDTDRIIAHLPPEVSRVESA